MLLLLVNMPITFISYHTHFSSNSWNITQFKAVLVEIDISVTCPSFPHPICDCATLNFFSQSFEGDYLEYLKHNIVYNYNNNLNNIIPLVHLFTLIILRVWPGTRSKRNEEVGGTISE